MADTISNLVFTNDTLSAMGVPLASYSGNLDVDYTTNSVSGSLSTTVLGTSQVQTYSSYSLSYDSGTNQYTLIGTSPGVTGSVSLTYTGQNPSTLASAASIAGLPALSGTAGAVVAVPICFAAGTAIRTPSGSTSIEDLEVGDLVMTTSGAARPIVWLGRRSIDCTSYEDPKCVWPIRIAADAFGPGRPSRDLYLSPQHSVAVTCLDEVLIPIRYLVNGATVRHAPRDSVDYWHVELDGHDLVLAEDLACESFLDTQGRGFFEDGAATEAPPLKTMADFCRPITLEGPVIAAVRAQMRRRLQQAGWTLDTNADLHLLADGVRIEPARSGDVVRFVVPAGTTALRLRSRTFVPAEFEIDSGDGRALGVALRAISVTDGLDVSRDLPLGDQPTSAGFWHLQSDGEIGWRWTNGDAALPAALWAGCAGTFFLRLELAAGRGHFKAWAPAERREVVLLEDFRAKAA